MKNLSKSARQGQVVAKGEQTHSGNAIVTSSVVSAIWICAGDESDCIGTLEQYIEALADLPITCELTVVVNGSVGALDEVLRMLRNCPLTTQVAQLHRPCDESTAIRAGMEASQGDLVVLLPGYVQTDPVAIVDMIAEVSGGAHYVATWRNPRIDSRWSSFKSSLFNACTSYMTGVTLHDINSGLRLMTREVADHLPIYGDLNRFAPILAASQGFKVVEVTVRHLKELRVEKGDSRFGVYLRRALDLLTLFFLFKFTKKPLRFFGLIGTLCLAAGTVVIGSAFIPQFLDVDEVNRPALLVGVVLAVLGAQLFSVGLLGELIIFTHGRELFYQHVAELKAPSESTDDSECRPDGTKRN